MRLPLPQLVLVQVTRSSSVFWRHLRSAPPQAWFDQRDMAPSGSVKVCCRGTQQRSAAGGAHQWQVTPCMESYTFPPCKQASHVAR
jgi:hypothetical protein